MFKALTLLPVLALSLSLGLLGCGETSNQGSGGSGGATPNGGAGSPSLPGNAGSDGRAGSSAGSGGATSGGGSGGSAGRGGASPTAGRAGANPGASGGTPASAGAGGDSSGNGGTTGGTGGADEPTAGEGGSSGEGPFEVPFILGADISSVQESGLSFRDTDGATKSIFALLKNHGFNYVRLKTFVDPSAPYGYASSANGCAGLPEPFGDRDHVIAFGKQAKAAGMGLLVDFHYSDVWADPGNQIIPEPWRDAEDITELAALVKAYTKDFISKGIAEGARPDMVQIGNEITPGMLMHVPGANTDCWGNNPAAAPFGGSTAHWDDLATLLKAGISAVREVDPSIGIMLHVENTEDLPGVKRWVDSALARGVEFDVLGLSCYVQYQGQPSVWENTFENLAESYPDLKFAIAEYNPARSEANRLMKALPDGRGLGTFFWEPSRSGDWGQALFTFQGGTATARSADFAEFDALRSELGL